MRLSYTTQPSGNQRNQPLTTQPVVTVLNADGTTMTGFSGPITISLASGTPGAVLTGNTTVNAVNGVAQFSGLTLD